MQGANDMPLGANSPPTESCLPHVNGMQQGKNGGKVGFLCFNVAGEAVEKQWLFLGIGWFISGFMAKMTL